MTVVIAITTKSKVVLAGDSYCGDEDVRQLCAAPKILTVAPDVGFGLCGSVRSEQALAPALKKLLKRRSSIENYIMNRLADDLHSLLRDRGILRDNDGIHSLPDSDYILTHKGKIFYLDEEFAIWEPQHPYAAIGIGRRYALGALAYIHENIGFKSNTIEKQALSVIESVARHCNLVDLPAKSLVLKCI